jgi:hypothetical protein
VKTSRSGSARQTLGQIFAGPILVGVLSTLGLVSALVGDGFWDGVSWVTLLVPILLGAAFIARGRRR